MQERTITIDLGPTAEAGGPDERAVTIRRSARRRKTVHAAAGRDGRLILSVPVGLTEAQEVAWARELLPKVLAKAARDPLDDAELTRRAQALRRYLPGVPQPASIRWVHNQNTRWGSCTYSSRTIRISHRVARFPRWVQDAVIVHELAHLRFRGHGPDFWAAVAAYPHTDRAVAFLQGVAYGMGEQPGEGWVEPDDQD